MTLVLIMLYIFDQNRLEHTVRDYEHNIAIIKSQLNAGENIMEEVNDLRENFSKNLELLDSYIISGNELMNEISGINSLAKKLKVRINNLEIDPRNTFPDIFQSILDKQEPLERQTLSFDLSGSFLDIGNFVETLETSNSPLRLQYCSIFLDSLDPKGVIAELQYAIYGKRNL